MGNSYTRDAINATTPDVNKLSTPGAPEPDVKVVVVMPDQVRAAEPERLRVLLAKTDLRARAIFEKKLLPALATRENYRMKNGRAHLSVRLLVEDQVFGQFIELVEQFLPERAPCYECCVQRDDGYGTRVASYVIVELTERDKSPAAPKSLLD
jgi:hypothetical protein